MWRRSAGAVDEVVVVVVYDLADESVSNGLGYT